MTLQDVQNARVALKDFVTLTHVEQSRSLSRILGTEVFLKYENLQRTGSFKIRGAYNKIRMLSAEEKKRGVIASSAGNHAQGVALSAQTLGLQATIVMPRGASLNKITATESYGAKVILAGDFYDQAYTHALQLAKETGAVFVHPYEDEAVIAGQGTLGLEVLEQIKDLESLVVAVGGGGLISGLGVAVKSINPICKIIGVQSQNASAMKKLFCHEPQENSTENVKTIADGIAVKNASLPIYNNFISKYVDEMVTVSDDEIAASIVFLMERAKCLVEGAGAATVAAMLNRKLNLGRRTCALLCGGNIDLNVIAKVVERGLISQRRLVEISLVMTDQPGQLYKFTGILSDLGANILDVRHDRVERQLTLREAKVDFLIECRGDDHAQSVKKALVQAGARYVKDE